MSSGLAVTDVRSGDVLQVPLDEANDFFADPSAIVADARGRRAYIASGGADVVTVMDLDRLAAWMAAADARTRQEAIYDMALSPEYVTARVPTGRNPRQLALSPDGGKLFIAERLDDSILVIPTRRAWSREGGSSWGMEGGTTRSAVARGFSPRRLTHFSTSFRAAPVIPTATWMV